MEILSCIDVIRREKDGGGGEGKDGRMRGGGRGVGGQCAKCAAVRHTAPQCATVRQTAFAAPPLKLPVPKKREKPPKSRSATVS